MNQDFHGYILVNIITAILFSIGLIKFCLVPGRVSDCCYSVPNNSCFHGLC